MPSKDYASSLLPQSALRIHLYPKVGSLDLPVQSFAAHRDRKPSNSTVRLPAALAASVVSAAGHLAVALVMSVPHFACTEAIDAIEL